MGTKLAHCLIAVAVALFAASLLQAQIPIKVVVVTTLENGDDITGNGEFQAWAADLLLPIVIHFPGRISGRLEKQFNAAASAATQMPCDLIGWAGQRLSPSGPDRYRYSEHSFRC